MDNQKNVYKDWLNGVESNYTDRTGHYSATIEITNAKKRAWGWLVEIGIDLYKSRAKFKLDNQLMKDPLIWLENEIDKVQQFIQDNREAEQKYLEDLPSIKPIDGQYYKLIEKVYQGYKENDEEKDVKALPPIKDEMQSLFKMYIYKEYLPYLEKLLKGVEPVEKSSEETLKGKPHKDDIYRKFGELKGEFGVKNAFYKLCDWIENLECDVDDYIETDTPQYFDRSYRNWLKGK